VSGWLETVRRHRLTIVGLAVALLLGSWMVSSLLAPYRDRIKESIRQGGYPATMSELDAWYPSVPPAENAALVYTNAFALLTNATGPNSAITTALPPIGRAFSPDEEAALKAELAENAAALRLIYSAPASGRSHYAVRLEAGFDGMLPHLAKTKQAVTLLSAAGLMYASDGDAERATQAFLAAARVADSLAEEPTVVSQFVRCNDWAWLLQGLERALSLTRFSDGQLAAMQKLVLEAERPRAMARAMAVERVCGLNVMTDPKGSATAVRSQGGHRQWHGIAGSVCMGLFWATGLQRKDTSFYAERMAEHIAALELPYPERAKAGNQVAALTNPSNRLCIFSRMLLPALVAVPGRDAKHVATVRTAAAALAVERFRLAHTNALPERLDQAAPYCCTNLPADPFDGQPLRYKTHGGSYVVYSIGSDGKDDGGVVWDANYSKVRQDISILVRH